MSLWSFLGRLALYKCIYDGLFGKKDGQDDCDDSYRYDRPLYDEHGYISTPALDEVEPRSYDDDDEWF